MLPQEYRALFPSDESFPGLEKGMAREEFETFVNNMLRNWNIQPQWRERVQEAIEFQYTYWPEPDNMTARGQMFIDVSSPEKHCSVVTIQASPLLFIFGTCRSNGKNYKYMQFVHTSACHEKHCILV